VNGAGCERIKDRIVELDQMTFDIGAAGGDIRRGMPPLASGKTAILSSSTI
jgi:hypothetical protein